MTDKERLEEIETKYSTLAVTNEKNNAEYIEVDVEDLVFLIQTCWKAIEGMTISYDSLTDRHVNITKEILEEYQEENERLEQQNRRYREAIEWALYESAWCDEGNALAAKVVDILSKALGSE